MFGPFSRPTAIFIIFCNVLVRTEDFLEYYKPKPGLPRELNDWLSDVQLYKSDFRLIRAIAEKQEKKSFDYDTDNIEDKNTNSLDNLEDDNDYIDEVPKNDIYPHMYKQKKSPFENFGTTFDKLSNKKKLVPENKRQRRYSNKQALSDDGHVDINPKSDDGNVQRSGDKYPERFSNNLKDNNRKREIQIDVLNDGKLVKQIKENDRDPKSIVLNIQSLDKFRNPPPPYKPEPIEMNQVQSIEPQVKEFPTQRSVDPEFYQINNKELPNNLMRVSPSQRSVDSEAYQMNNRELSDNFRNLFNANENLNTDSSIARERLLGQTALLYRVTLPDPDNLFLPEQDKVTVNEENHSDFNRNGFKDMSQFWTATEKNQMQKGIEFARGNWNPKAVQSTQQSVDSDGFELVKSVVIDPDSDSLRMNSKRESQAIEGRVSLDADGNDRNVVYNADMKSSKGAFDSYVPVNSDEGNVDRKVSTAPTIVVIESETRDEIVQGAIESIQPDINLQLGEDVNPPPDSPVGDQNVESNVEQLIPEEYRETTPEFIIPAPEDGPAQEIENIGVQSNEEKQIKPSDEIVETSNDMQVENENRGSTETVDCSKETSIENEGLNEEEPCEHKLSSHHKHSKGECIDETDDSEMRNGDIEDILNTPSSHHHEDREHQLQNECSKPEHHHHHLTNAVPRTKIHKIDQNIHDHLMVTRIETVTVLNRKQGTEEELSEEEEEPEEEYRQDSQEQPAKQCHEDTHLKTVRIFTKPLNKHRANNRRKIQRSQLRNYIKPAVPTPHCEDGNCAEGDENIEHDKYPKHLETKRKRRKQRKHKSYRDKIRFNVGRDINDEFLPNDSDEIPAFGRQLQGVEYVYDSDMGPRGEAVAAVTPDEEHSRVGLLDKNLADEEASNIIENVKNGDMVEETNNVFANPVDPIAEDEEYDEDQASPTDDPKLASFGRRIHEQGKSTEKDMESKAEVEFLPDDSDEIPALGRHLQGVEYVYDVDMGPMGEAVATVTTTEKHSRLGLLHKNSVEGDYGDEEDSMTKERKKDQLVKKTDNKFANPVDATTEEDDDDEDYVEEPAETNNTSGDSGDGAPKDDQKLVSFGRRLHKQAKAPKTDKDKKAMKTKAKKVREAPGPPSQRLLDKSEFQHWPQFVVSDKINEEILRKRSLAAKNAAPIVNNFPLSSKNFFTKSNPKRRDSPELDIAMDKSSSSNSVTSEKPFMDFDKPTNNDMEVKLNLNLNMDDKDHKADQGNDVTLFPPSTTATSSNQSLSTTVEEECDMPKVSVGNVCEENENFNKTKVALTTVLSIIPDTQGEMINETYNKEDDFVKLDDILTGRLPFKILQYIRSHMRKDKKLKDRFLRGMKKSHGLESFQNLPDITNEESRKIINAMASLMNRLQITSTCQTLPRKLLHYLKSATRVRLEDALARAKEMEEVEFDDIQNQDTFIFQSNSRADNLEEKVRVLKDLLTKYNHLPDRCKPRAEPVREYVMNHLKMLTNMLSVDQLSPPRPKKTVQARMDEDGTEAPYHQHPFQKTTDTDLVEQQLESLGLGNLHNFRPKFSLDELMEHQRTSKEVSEDKDNKVRSDNKKNKRDLDREEISEKYEKLRKAVKKERIKRDSRRRIAENFGKLSIEDYKGESSRREQFEAPLVFSF